VFGPLEDPRCPINRRHLLSQRVVIAIAGVLAGANGGKDIERFGRAKEQWLRPLLTLSFGIPSHDPVGRVFSLLDAQAFEACFGQRVSEIGELIPDEVIAVDGKTLRGWHERAGGPGALHLVSAWATAHRVVLGQVATEAKSNEITAIPQLLALLHLEGCTVTIDAMGCHTKTAAQVRAQGADDVLALKGQLGDPRLGGRRGLHQRPCQGRRGH
jgi:hypothetical protein